MVNLQNVSFPITGEALAALQREQLGRGWVLLGCQRGTERLKAAIDGVS